MRDGLLGMVRSLRSTFPDHAWWRTSEEISFLLNAPTPIAYAPIYVNSLVNQMSSTYFSTQAENAALLAEFYQFYKVHATKIRISVTLPPSTTLTDFFARNVRIAYLPILNGQGYTLPTSTDLFASTIMEQQGALLSPQVNLQNNALHFEFFTRSYMLAGRSKEQFLADTAGGYSGSLLIGGVTAPATLLGGILLFCVQDVSTLSLLVNVEFNFYCELMQRRQTSMLGAFASSDTIAEQLTGGLQSSVRQPVPIPACTPDVIERILSLPPPGPPPSDCEGIDDRLIHPWGPNNPTIMDYYFASAAKLRSTLSARDTHLQQAFMKGLVPSVPFSDADESVEADE